MNLSKLQIWTRAVNLGGWVYEVTELFPQSELYGLTSQMRRAATSVPSNIAEGSQRGTNKDFAKFILIAKGSLAEVQSQVSISRRAGYVSEAESEKLLKEIDELHRMLFAFHSRLVSPHSKLDSRNS